MQVRTLEADERKMYRILRRTIIDNGGEWIGPMAMGVHVAAMDGPDTEAIQFSDNGVLLINFSKLEDLPVPERNAEILHGWTHIFFEHAARGKELEQKSGGRLSIPDWTFITCALAGGYVGSENSMVKLRDDFPTLQGIDLPDEMTRTAEKIYLHIMKDQEQEQDSDGDGEGEGGEGEGSEAGEGEGSDDGSCGGAVKSSEHQALRDLGMDPEAEKLLREETLNGIRNSGKMPGSDPGEIERVIDRSTKKPQVAWEQKFRGLMSAAIDIFKNGMADYSFHRYNPFFQNSELIMPRLSGDTKPEVAVIVDTSGSVDESGLRAALTEIKGIMSTAVIKGYAVDAGVTRLGPIASLDDFKFHGGGGTDMTAGIIAAAEDGADLAIVLTDGEFYSWPEVPIEDKPSMQCIVGVIGYFGENEAYADSLVKHIPYWIEHVVISLDTLM